MNITYFPGANTPLGFYSRFDAVLSDPRVRRRIYIKGGPGCGKSTLMRRLAQLDPAAELGLCSSDPDSADTVLLPQAGLVVCDATAPHVCEPPLGGVDGVYLDLSRFYDTAALQEKAPELKKLQRAGKACYTPATHALQAAQALYRQRQALVAGDARREVEKAAHLAAAPWLEPGQDGGVRQLFLTGVTPAGCQNQFSLLQRAKTRYLLHDSYHLAGSYLQRILELARDAGQPVVAGYSPLFPAAGPEQLYLPGPGVAWIRRSSHFGPALTGPVLDLDTLVQDDSQTRRSAAWLRELTEQILSEAVSHLRRAKACHDELEALLHPHVDFAGVSALANELAVQVLA